LYPFSSILLRIAIRSTLHRSTPPPRLLLSLPGALPISRHGGIARSRRAGNRPRSAKGAARRGHSSPGGGARRRRREAARAAARRERKSTRLNSSHGKISYAVFFLKKKINKDYARLFWT